ncbi:hypothetical protein [Methylobrevis pamukkalensis]|uniref:hypothetical protein n=1 Tax=Methylobrevis pamukkalensis TaxID=1439726 RepID=UPI001470B599|nr:hypothetical protein [Methylobrevis pamukkalensis]
MLVTVPELGHGSSSTPRPQTLVTSLSMPVPTNSALCGEAGCVEGVGLCSATISVGLAEMSPLSSGLMKKLKNLS